MIEKLLENNRSLGFIGNTNTAKTSLALTELINLGDIGLTRCVYGVEESLHSYLESQGIIIIRNREDILDLKIRDAIIYIDEFADVFDVNIKSKQGDRIKRFFNRLNHLNVWVMLSTAQAKFWNTFICGLVKTYVVKSIEYSALVNGTDLKKKIMGISTYSDYRLETGISKYYIISEGMTTIGEFDYNSELDSKKNNFNPFKNMTEKFINENVEENVEEKKYKNVEMQINPFNLNAKTINEEIGQENGK